MSSYQRRRKIIHPGTSVPTPKQVYAPGWWTVLLFGDLYSKVGSNFVYQGLPASADVPNSVGVCPSHDWNELEPNGKTDSPSTRFAPGIAMITSELATCAAMNGGKGRKYMLRIGVKSFRGPASNPLPADMQVANADNNHNSTGYATYFPGSPTIPDGFGTWRWHLTNQARFLELLLALGAAFGDPAGNGGNNALFVGINLQETAMGFNPDARVDTYTPAAYISGLIFESKCVPQASPYWRPHPMYNYFPGSYTDASGAAQSSSNAQGTINLAIAAAGVQQYGAVLSFPDLVTSGGPVSRVYGIHQAYSTGGQVPRAGTTPLIVIMPGMGPTGGSMQHDELAGVGVGDTPVVLENLFNYATSTDSYGPSGSSATHKPYPGALDYTSGSPLTVDYLFVNNTGGSPANHMMADYPTFGPFTPS